MSNKTDGIFLHNKYKMPIEGIFIHTNRCPKCGAKPMFGTTTMKNYGFLGLHTKRISFYTCRKCGYKYEIEEI